MPIMFSRPTGLTALVAVLFLSASGHAVADDPTPDGPEGDTAKVQVVIQSRSGPVILANVMDRLLALSKKPEFREVLTLDYEVNGLEDCERNARRDPSGRVFDLAQCVRAWPSTDKANTEKIFERSFSELVRQRGTSAFPAATVTPFEFELRMQRAQLKLPKEFRGDAGDGKPHGVEASAEFKKFLCNPNITFIEGDTCKKNLRVVSRLGAYEADIYIPQVGYQVDASKPMRPKLATDLRRAILKDLELPDKSPNAVRVIVVNKQRAKQEQKDNMPASPQADTGKELSELWSTLGVTDGIDLGKTEDGTPPTLLLFDNQVTAPASIVEWLGKLKIAQREVDNCSSESGHSFAAAGMLFPRILLSRARGDNSVTSIVSMDWKGYILGANHFQGEAIFNGSPWYRRSLFAKPGDPIVGLTVFSLKYTKDFESQAFNAAAYLSEPSNLLVVAAAQRAKNEGATEFRRDVSSPTVDPGGLEDVCANRTWPACLGRHPRVLVVGPSLYPETTKNEGEVSAEVFSPNEYYLGASTVRILAPGGNVPVFAKCGGAENADTSTGQISRASGTSFGAPLVALVTTRLLQIGPPELRQNLPEAAFWRILATSTPLQIPAGLTANPASQFGRVNAGKALLGSTANESGPNNAALLYEEDQDGNVLASQAVVLPYPWMDQEMLLRQTGLEPRMRELKRGVITVSAVLPEKDGRETMEFNRILRIVRRANEEAARVPLFDIYYVSGHDAKQVLVRRRVRFGTGNFVEVPGYCRSDGQPLRGDDSGRVQFQAQPGCLYAWRQGSQGFSALNLSSLREIVFPVLHWDANLVARIDPTDFTQMTSKESPWRPEVCRTGPRIEAQKVLSGYTVAKLAAACTTDATSAK